jgi:arsenate reductase
MAEKGIDISGHKPRLTSEFDAADWDLIISMGCGVRCSSLPINDDWDIPDPYQDSIEKYRATRDDLEMKVRKLVEKAEAVE